MMWQLRTTDGITAIDQNAIVAVSYSKADVLKGVEYFRVHLNSGKYFCVYFEGRAQALLRLWLPTSDLGETKFEQEVENG